MTITPDQAQALLEDTTPGPWEWADCDDEGGGTHMALRNPHGEKALHTVDAESYASWVEGTPEDLRLAATAPTMAEQIAGMRPEYRAEFQTAGGRWFPTPHRCSCSSGWGTKQQAARHAADWKADGYAARIVRRLVGESEVVG